MQGTTTKLLGHATNKPYVWYPKFKLNIHLIGETIPAERKGSIDFDKWA